MESLLTIYENKRKKYTSIDFIIAENAKKSII